MSHTKLSLHSTIPVLLYRDKIKGLQIMLSRTRASSGRAVVHGQEQILRIQVDSKAVLYRSTLYQGTFLDRCLCRRHISNVSVVSVSPTIALSKATQTLFYLHQTAKIKFYIRWVQNPSFGWHSSLVIALILLKQQRRSHNGSNQRIERGADC